MEYLELGNTGIVVSRLCFGGLIIGPLQANLPAGRGADIIVKAMEMGVNFIDTAELYGTYPHIKEALRRLAHRGSLREQGQNRGISPVIATKSYAYTREDARKSLDRARKEMDLDIVDIFLLHEQESRHTLAGHRDALEYYISAREKGIIRAVGVSTHNIEVVEACTEMPEIDIIHPIVNRMGIGIRDGNIDQMLSAVRKAYDAGKGIYSMKPLGGGNLIGSYRESMDFVLRIPYIHSIAVGMQSVEEVIMNVSVFEGRGLPASLEESLNRKKRKLHIDYWCEGCGRCARRCGQSALEVVDGKAVVHENLCTLCGYCGSVCPQFAIKIY